MFIHIVNRVDCATTTTRYKLFLILWQPGPRYIVIIFSAIHTGTRITLAHFDTRGIGVRALFPRQWRNRARNIVEKTHGVSEFMWTEVSHVIIDLSTYLTRNRAACLESSTSLSFHRPRLFSSLSARRLMNEPFTISYMILRHRGYYGTLSLTFMFT